MKFSVIMPSYLGKYQTAAKARDQKIHRAIQSVINQQYKDWELFVIADGCQKTVNILQSYVEKYDNIRCSLIDKQALFSGNPRNFGIYHSIGDYICYLDIDDYFMPNHLVEIGIGLRANPTAAWVYFDDYTPILNGKAITWKQRTCSIDRKHHFGTSNLCHRKDLNVFWKNTGYLHDFYFAEELKKFPGQKIAGPHYCVCHSPQQWDI